MKTLVSFVIALSLGATAWSQAIRPEEVVGPNNTFRDPVFGVTLTYPAGWQVRGGARWGKNGKENTIGFQPIWPLEAGPSLYYQPNYEKPGPDQIEAYFRRTAASKAASRTPRSPDYRNLENTFVFGPINGQPGFRYTASFTVQGKPYFEYFVRVMGAEVSAMFFVTCPADEIDMIRREVDQMAATIHVP